MDYLFNDVRPTVPTPNSWLFDLPAESVEYRRLILNFGSKNIVVKEHTGLVYEVPVAMQRDFSLAGNVLVKERYEFPKSSINSLLTGIKATPTIETDNGKMEVLKEIFETGNYQDLGEFIIVDLDTKIDFNVLVNESNVYHYNTNLLFSVLTPDALPPHPQSMGGKEFLNLRGHSMDFLDESSVLKLEIVDNTTDPLTTCYLAASPEDYFQLTPIKDKTRKEGLHVWEKKPEGMTHSVIVKDEKGVLRWRNKILYNAYAEVLAIENKTTKQQQQEERELQQQNLLLKKEQAALQLTMEEHKAKLLKEQIRLDEIKKEAQEKELILQREQKQMDFELSKIQHEQKKEESTFKRDLAVISFAIAGAALIKKLFF